MINNFIKNGLIYFVGNILTKSVHLISLPLIVNYLSPKDFGVYDYVLILTAIVNIVVTIEITQATCRFYPELKTNLARISYTSTAFLFVISALAIFYVAISFFSEGLSLYFFETEDQQGFQLGVLSIIVSTLLYFTQNQLKWEVKPKATILVGLTNALVFLLSILYFILQNNMNIYSLFKSAILAGLFATILAIYCSKENYRLVFELSKLKKMLDFSFPLVFSSAGMYVSLYVDRFVIIELIGVEKLGVYAFASRFALIASLVMVSFQSSLVPLVYKYYEEKGTSLEISRIFSVYMSIFVFVLGGSYLFSYEIVFLFGSEEFYDAKELIFPLVLAAFLSGLYMFFPGLFIAKKTRLISVVTITSAFLNAVLNYLLIPLLGLEGAAYSTVITSFFMAVFFFKLGGGYYPIRFEWKRIVVAFGVSFICIYFIAYCFQGVSLIGFIVKFLVLLCVFIMSLCLIAEKNIFKLVGIFK